MTHSTPSLSCSCCETKQEHRAFLLPLKLVTAPYQDALLCDACIETCHEILEEEEIATDAVPAPSPVRIHAPRCQFRQHHCSFCGRAETQVMRLIALLHDLRMCNLCVGACNAVAAALNRDTAWTGIAELDKEGSAIMEQPSSPQSPIIARELDLGAHTLFIMDDGSIDLVTNDEQTVYLADNAVHLDGEEAYRLCAALHEHFKQRETQQ